MSCTYILYNSLAGNKNEYSAKIEKLKTKIKDESITVIDVTTINSYGEFIENTDENDKIYLCGGDGTLNQFVNQLGDKKIKCEIYYYGTGTGNDFLRDLDKAADCEPFLINKYIEDLPTVTVNGSDYRFLNNVGFGIDGYCTEVGDNLKKTTDKDVNYTAIAIKGLLFHYRPTNATVTVDGKKYTYKKVWLAPTMNGRYYGGGMMPTPNQNRLSDDGKVSVMLMHGSGKLSTLMIFPSLFKGEHVKNEKIVALHTGSNITVEFDKPTTLQIDGETMLGVTKYEAHGRKTAANIAELVK